MRVLVTGCAGFIGMHTCLRLLARGDEVIGLDNLNDYYDVNLKEDRLKRLFEYGGFSFHKLDMTDQVGGHSFGSTARCALFTEEPSRLYPK